MIQTHAQTKVTGNRTNLFEEDVTRDLQKWERCASP